MLCYAKSLQLCPTLCDPIDGSPPGSPVPGILQARTPEWVATSFSNAWKWKVKAKSLSRVRLLATPWTAAYQAPPSMGFSRQKYWSGVQRSRPHLLQLKVPHAATKTCCSQIKKTKEKGPFLCLCLPQGTIDLLSIGVCYFAFPRILWTWNYTLCTISFIYTWFIDIYYWLTEHPGCWEGHMKNDILTYYGSICGSTTCEQDGSHSEFSKVQFF